jgi:hypothetical protein
MRLYQLFRAQNAAVAAVFIMTAVSASGQPVSASGQGQSVGLRVAVQSAGQSAALQQGETVRRLSIDEAVALAMEQNLGIKIQRFDPPIQDTGVSLAHSLWNPNFQTTVTRQSQTQASTNVLSGGSTVNNGTFASNVGLNQTLPWGGSYNLNFNSARLTSNSTISSFSPQLTSNLNAQYTQPLLRNFSIDQIRQQVALSKKPVTCRTFSSTASSPRRCGTSETPTGIWSYAINNLKAQQESLALSRQSLRTTRSGSRSARWRRSTSSRPRPRSRPTSRR